MRTYYNAFMLIGVLGSLGCHASEQSYDLTHEKTGHPIRLSIYIQEAARHTPYAENIVALNLRFPDIGEAGCPFNNKTIQLVAQEALTAAGTTSVAGTGEQYVLEKGFQKDLRIGLSEEFYVTEKILHKLLLGAEYELVESSGYVASPFSAVDVGGLQYAEGKKMTALQYRFHFDRVDQKAPEGPVCVVYYKWALKPLGHS